MHTGKRKHNMDGSEPPATRPQKVTRPNGGPDEPPLSMVACNIMANLDVLSDANVYPSPSNTTDEPEEREAIIVNALHSVLNDLERCNKTTTEPMTLNPDLEQYVCEARIRTLRLNQIARSKKDEEEAMKSTEGIKRIIESMQEDPSLNELEKPLFEALEAYRVLEQTYNEHREQSFGKQGTDLAKYIKDQIAIPLSNAQQTNVPSHVAGARATAATG